MSGRSPLEEQLRALFAEELDGHVAALNVELLALERATTDADVADRLQRLFRTTHTVKGASRAASAPLVEQLAHRLEDVLTGVREQRIDRDPLLYDALFGATDALALLRDDLAAGRPTPPGTAADILARLADLDGGVTDVVAVDTATLHVAPAAPVPANQVRIAADKIDTLLATSGELLVALGRLADGPDRRALVASVRVLHEDLKRLRMVPFRDACQALDRAARDIAAALGKEVELVVVGGELEIDRAVVDALRDPLLHIVRNAIDHGIEAPDDRVAAGKPRRGTVRVTASLRGADVLVEVDDDGRGLDLHAIRATLGRRGMAAPDDDRQVADSIFLPGFSTARMVTDVSGRGVGLDVVRRGIEGIRGAVEAWQRPGGGTRFEIRAPLSLSSLRVLLVVVSGQTFAIPASSVKILLRVARDDVQRLGGADTVRVDGRPVPLVPLATALGLGASPSLAQGRVPVVVLAGASQVAVVVDALLDELEVARGSAARARCPGRSSSRTAVWRSSCPCPRSWRGPGRRPAPTCSP